MTVMPFFTGARGRVHYRRWDAPNPVASMIFLHGRGQHSGDYHRFAGVMNEFDVTVWALDHFGHGLSEGEVDDSVLGVDEFLDGLTDDAAHLASLAVAATPELPLSIMGHSLGAAVAVRVVGSPCAATKFASLVVCATPPPLLTPALLKSVTATGISVLAVHGEDDRMVSIDSARELLGSVELLGYQNTGHDVLHEKVHREVTEEVAHFVPVREDRAR